MKSLFGRQFSLYAIVIIFGFALLGSTFMYQVNVFSEKEKQTQLDKVVTRAAQQTQDYLIYTKMWNSIEYNLAYMRNMQQLAQDLDGIIFVADRDGNLMFVAREDGCFQQTGGVMPKEATDILLDTGSYYVQMSKFYDWLSTACHIQGVTVKNAVSNGVDGMVFAAAPPNNVLYFNLSRTFLLIIMIVLLLTLIVSIVVVGSTVKPLSEMARVTRNFARGDFSSRVPLPDRHDEIYDMTVSFNRMADSMENVENNRRGLIASVSHDLRTPMTTIGGFVDGILDGTIKQENQEKYLRIISDEVKRLSRMASSMLEVSRLETGEREMNSAVFDMSELVRRVIIGFEQKLSEKRVEVALDIPDTINMLGDHDSMFQVVYNLVDNAVKFTPPDGMITVAIEEKGGNLKCRVINTGSEIKQADLSNIFNRFFKGDQSRSTSGTGSGLGLYIVKTIINRHGGDVSATSDKGKVEFSFTVPTGV